MTQGTPEGAADARAAADQYGDLRQAARGRGRDPGNTLRLREQPSNSATIILLIPNNTLVTRVAGSVEMSAAAIPG